MQQRCLGIEYEDIGLETFSLISSMKNLNSLSNQNTYSNKSQFQMKKTLNGTQTIDSTTLLWTSTILMTNLLRTCLQQIPDFDLTWEHLRMESLNMLRMRNDDLKQLKEKGGKPMEEKLHQSTFQSMFWMKRSSSIFMSLETQGITGKTGKTKIGNI